MWFFQQNLAKLEPREGQAYVAGVARLRIMMCGSSALQQPVQDFFSSIRNGNPILTRYGASEFPGCIKVPSGSDFKLMPKGCVGLPVPGVDLKLSDGDEGELLVKSPYMFSKLVPLQSFTISWVYEHLDICMIQKQQQMHTTKTATSKQATSAAAPAPITSSWAAPPSTSLNPGATKSPLSTSKRNPRTSLHSRSSRHRCRRRRIRAACGSHCYIDNGLGKEFGY